MHSAPLYSLLRSALRSLEQTYIKEGAGIAGMPSLDQWANLLRIVNRVEAPVRTLPESLRLSKRAVRLRLSWAVRHRLIDERTSDSVGPAVRLTDSGERVAIRWRSLQDTAENKWRAMLGAAFGDKLRASLERLVAMLPLEHPHYPASYGAVDASITGGHGTDWKAVPRESRDTVSSLPISALLSQPIVAFAMDYEAMSPVALSLAAAVIKHIPKQGRPLDGLGHPVGISALQRHGFVQLTRVAGKQAVSLTPKGAAAADGHDEWVRTVETNWSHAFGSANIQALRQSLEDLAGD